MCSKLPFFHRQVVPTNLSVVERTSNSITLSWNFNSSAKIEGFRVFFTNHGFWDVHTHWDWDWDWDVRERRLHKLTNLGRGTLNSDPTLSMVSNGHLEIDRVLTNKFLQMNMTVYWNNRQDLAAPESRRGQRYSRTIFLALSLGRVNKY